MTFGPVEVVAIILLAAGAIRAFLYLRKLERQEREARIQSGR